MVIFYVLLVAYILAVNFYAFLLVKTLRNEEESGKTPNDDSSATNPNVPKTTERPNGKLFLTGFLGGAITVYACMFLFKYKRTDLLLMLVMPLFAVLNVYVWIMLFRSGFSFFVLRGATSMLL